MAIYKNATSQKLAVFAYDLTNGTPVTGNASNITAQISLDGGATAATNDVNPTELDATDAPGIYIFDLTQAETNADLLIVVPVSATSDVELDPSIIYTTPGTNAALLADTIRISGDSVAADNAEAFFDGTGYAGTTDWNADERTAIRSILGIPGSGTTPVAPTVGVLDTIRDKTDLIPANPASTTNITSASGVTVAAIGLNAITAAAIASDAGEELANALLDLTNGVETSTTLRQAFRIIVAALAGKVNGAAGTTINIRNLADTLNRITATVDADGNRTAVTTDLG